MLEPPGIGVPRFSDFCDFNVIDGRFWANRDPMIPLKNYVALYGNWERIGVTEMTGNVSRTFLDPVFF